HAHRRTRVVVHPAALPITAVAAPAAVACSGEVPGHQGGADRDRPGGREGAAEAAGGQAAAQRVAAPDSARSGAADRLVLHECTALADPRPPAKEVEEEEAAADAEAAFLIDSTRAADGLAAEGLIVVQHALADRRHALEDKDPAAKPVTGAVRAVR